MMVEFDTRRDGDGWTVFDRWTGQAVVLNGAEQVGLTWVDADQLVERLNSRRLEGDRSILQ